LLGTFTGMRDGDGSGLNAAWQGVPSHFNMETGFDEAVAQTLAIGGFTLGGVIVALTVAALHDSCAHATRPAAGVEAGLIAWVGAQIVGALMIATAVRLLISGDPRTAYANGGWLKPVHAVLMHGILVLPMLAWLTTSGRNESSQLRIVRDGVAAYVLADGPDLPGPCGVSVFANSVSSAPLAVFLRGDLTVSHRALPSALRSAAATIGLQMREGSYRIPSRQSRHRWHSAARCCLFEP
jgi:hypothetical protein